MQQGDPRLPATTEVGRTAGPGGGRGTRQRGLGVGKREREEYLAQVAEKERALGEEAED